MQYNLSLHNTSTSWTGFVYQKAMQMPKRIWKTQVLQNSQGECQVIRNIINVVRWTQK